MDVHERLNSFLDASSPKLARFLCHMWQNQQDAITYRELRDAIMDGSLGINYLMNWQEDYSKFIADSYTPLVNAAVKATKDALNAQYGNLLNDQQSDIMDAWIQDHGGRLIRQASVQQYTAINQLVREAAMTDTMTVDELARCIRPCIGLTQYQANMVKKYYDQLRNDGYDKKDAQRKQLNYAAKIHRRRATSIAETELAYAYNTAADKVVQQAIIDGVFEAGAKKRWSTALDERVCSTCGGVDGETVDISAEFSVGKQLPPAHPNCRCTVEYDVVPAVQAQTQAAQRQGTLPRNYDCDFAKALGKDEYDHCMDILDKCSSPELKAVWAKYEQHLKVGSTNCRGTEHFNPSDCKVYLKVRENAVANSDQAAHSVTFHEIGHAIDYIANSGIQTSSSYYSNWFSNGLFPKTIRDEAAELVDSCGREIKARIKADDVQWLTDHDLVYKVFGYYQAADDVNCYWREGDKVALKYKKALAYDYVSREMRKLPSYARAGASDIMGGVTLNKANGGWTHRTSYWKKDPELLPTEAFANMLSVTATGGEGLDVMKQYFPKSYEMFIEMLRSIV